MTADATEVLNGSSAGRRGVERLHVPTAGQHLHPKSPCNPNSVGIDYPWWYMEPGRDSRIP